MVEPTDEGPITASATVSVVPGPLGVDPGGQQHLDALLAPLAPKQASGDDDTWRQVSVVEVPGTDGAARAWGVEDVDLPQDAGWVRVVQLLQLVPVPGQQPGRAARVQQPCPAARRRPRRPVPRRRRHPAGRAGGPS